MSDTQRHAPDGDNWLSYLTPDDRKVLEAATGYEISSDGTVLNPGKDPVDSLIVMTAIQRHNGQLQGELASGHLTGLFKQYGGSSDMAASFSADRLDKALDLLADRDARRAQGVTRASFNVGV